MAVPLGEGFSAQQRRDVDRAIRSAETVSRFEFTVFVGAVQDDKRDYAERLHAVLPNRDRTVLIMVDPAAHALEVVTGSVVRRTLDDDAVRLAVVTMQSAFADGDLVAGLERGLAQLAAAARAPETLHSD